MTDYHGVAKAVAEAIVLPHGADQEEWLALRRTGIGGSDIGAIIGQNPWRRPLEVFLEKRGQMEGKKANLIMEAGSHMEPLIRRKFFEQSPDISPLMDKPVGTIRHKEYPFVLANVDDLVVDEYGCGVAEYKYTTGPVASRHWRGNGYPEWHWCQLQWYLGVLSSWVPENEHFDHGYLVGMVPKVDEYLIQKRLITRDDAWFQAALERAIKFWEYVEGDASAAFSDTEFFFLDNLSGSEETFKALGRVFPGGAEHTELDSSVDRLCLELETVQVDKKNLVEQEAQLRSQIAIHMADSTRGASNMFRISWPTIDGRRVFNTKGFISDNPELDLSNYYKQGKQYRGAMKITRAKGE